VTNCLILWPIIDYFLVTTLSLLVFINVVLETINLIMSNVNLTTDALETIASLVTFLYFFTFLLNFKSVIHDLDMSCYTKPSLAGFNNIGKLPSCV